MTTTQADLRLARQMSRLGNGNCPSKSGFAPALWNGREEHGCGRRRHGDIQVLFAAVVLPAAGLPGPRRQPGRAEGTLVLIV
jgi:hypothetical protein